ncbi:MAG: TIGR03790 family protein [Desulfobulbus sp.]|jgi:uncharacterized protein (TIGR03790 family)
MKRCASHFFTRYLLGLALVLIPAWAAALEPEEILVVANTRAPAGLRLAEYYMQKRGIPPDHLVQIRCLPQERCSRQVYEREIRLPVRRALEQRDNPTGIRCLVVLYGVPLAIQPDRLSETGTDQSAPAAKATEAQPAQPVQESDSRRRIERPRRLQEPPGRPARKQEPPGRPARKVRDSVGQDVQTAADGWPRRPVVVNAETGRIWRQIGQVGISVGMDDRAAVDSELMLVLVDDYPLDGWIPNPYFLGFRGQPALIPRDNVLIVSRLDGPDPATVRRMIDDSLQAEAQGLRGQACFDARWPVPTDKKNLRGYGRYDNALHQAAATVRASGRMPVQLDQAEALFSAGSCPNTALYCGWYSLATYVDAFTWARGAIGYHLASSECTTLKRRGSQVWCKRMLEEGAAATIGPVSEPYIESFPQPDIFFTKLLEGYLGLGESYLVSLPYLSWQMVLIGDPLYRPFSPK